jgi:transmembrane sensor
VAAVAVVIFGAGLFFYNHGQKNILQPIEYVNDAAPGKQGATLTLAGGQKIHLGDAANGELAKQSGISITKTADGKLIYQVEQTRWSR